MNPKRFDIDRCLIDWLVTRYKGTNYKLSEEHAKLIRKLWDERRIRSGEAKAS